MRTCESVLGAEAPSTLHIDVHSPINVSIERVLEDSGRDCGLLGRRFWGARGASCIHKSMLAGRRLPGAGRREENTNNTDWGLFQVQDVLNNITQTTI